MVDQETVVCTFMLYVCRLNARLSNEPDYLQILQNKKSLYMSR